MAKSTEGSAWLLGGAEVAELKGLMIRVLGFRLAVQS